MHATNVGVLVPGSLADPAESVAQAAGDVAKAAAANTNVGLGDIIRETDLRELDNRVEAFRHLVIDQAQRLAGGGQPANSGETSSTRAAPGRDHFDGQKALDR